MKKIVVENGCYNLKNIGDITMLQVTVQRLNKLFPTSKIQVFTNKPEKLLQYCPGTIPVKNEYCRDYISIAKRKISTLFFEHKYQFDKELRQVINEADIVVTSGGGYIVDSFKYQGMSSLDILRLATNANKTTAILGHGFGVTKDRELRSKLEKFLPAVNLITVRERVFSIPLLTSLQISESKIAITGDDAIELAYQNRKNEQGDAIGVNVRRSNYSNIDRGGFDVVKEALEEVSTTLGTKLIAVPISLNEHDSDVATARDLNVDEDAEGLDTPLKVIQQVGRCRVVVTGSYHAGVFALSQGIPVVALASSKYYQEKFLGLADQFEHGCKVILFSEYPNTLKQEVFNSIKDAWDKSEDFKAPLLESAKKQIQRGYLAYEKLAKLAVNN